MEQCAAAMRAQPRVTLPLPLPRTINPAGLAHRPSVACRQRPSGPPHRQPLDAREVGRDAKLRVVDVRHGQAEERVVGARDVHAAGGQLHDARVDLRGAHTHTHTRTRTHSRPCIGSLQATEAVANGKCVGAMMPRQPADTGRRGARLPAFPIPHHEVHNHHGTAPIVSLHQLVPLLLQADRATAALHRHGCMQQQQTGGGGAANATTTLAPCR